MELNKIYNEDCRLGLKELQDNYVDLTVTSPPYDSLRNYKDNSKEGDDANNFEWNFDIFKEIANELYRVTKPGGVVVWVVGDEVNNGGETGTSFRQALYFQEIGFKIHDTMIYEKNSSTFPAKATSKRYSQIFEYMFVFSKGKIRNDIKLIADKKNKWAGWTNWGTKTQYTTDGELVAKKKNIKPTPEFSLRTNIWKYTVSFNDKTGHPAVFPEKLAEDHILSWTNEGDIVLDPFMGSGTTAKMAMLNGRNYIGFEKNTAYYDTSIQRVGKYSGEKLKTTENVSWKDTEGVSDELHYVPEDDKELNGKTELFNSLVEELNEYFNDMSLSILKTLKLTFQSKANDRRVEEVLKEEGIQKPENTANPDSPLIEKYQNDNDAFMRDCVKIKPIKCSFKNGMEVNSSVFFDEANDNVEVPAAKKTYIAPVSTELSIVRTGTDMDGGVVGERGVDGMDLFFASEKFEKAVTEVIKKIVKDENLFKSFINGSVEQKAETDVQPIASEAGAQPQKRKRGRPRKVNIENI